MVRLITGWLGDHVAIDWPWRLRWVVIGELSSRDSAGQGCDPGIRSLWIGPQRASSS